VPLGGVDAELGGQPVVRFQGRIRKVNHSALVPRDGRPRAGAQELYGGW
jgi:hypothetical protein